ncbi:TIGR03032 family protein [Methylotetracoccus oryzae]|uniref:TIGR03032 family protein n=1 Tax=Methylotetracoccus oryzae TaxID=1919059 RepID=UPI00111ADE51|nr:TIGR03032 family protein [Methylotetracoccus oryzae]
MALPFASQHTTSFPAALEQLGVSVLVSTYQAGQLIILRAQGGVLNTHFCGLERPMGLAAEGGRLAVGTGYQLIEYRDVPAVAEKLPDAERHDACYLPRQIHVTGDIDIHEMAYAADGELWLVNTRMSCLCTRDPAYSIRPRWRPPFVTGYDLTDRCHLNGLALKDGQPAFATALGRSDQAAGWRADKARGGILMSIPDGRIVAEGLSMPHSPRWHQGRLWVLESGAGTLATIDPSNGKKTVVAEVPGFTRGLDFVGRYAFVGLSQVRETAVFAGLPLTARVAERQCGVWVIDTATGATVAFVVFTGSVQEVFAVQVLPHRYPAVLDPHDDLLRTSYALPDEALAEIVPPDPVLSAIAQAAQAHRTGQSAAAVSMLGAILADQPEQTGARYELAKIHMDCESWHEAERELTRLVRDEPSHADAHHRLALCHAARGRWVEALQGSEASLAADGQFAAAHVTRGVVLLSEGRYDEGWAEWEWRRELPDAVRFACPQPLWTGAPISDQVLLVHTEGSLLDVVQFARFLPRAARHCRRLIVSCSEEQRPLLAKIEGVAEARIPDAIALDRFDVYCSLLSLPRLLGITRMDLPSTVPYLSLADISARPAPLPGKGQRRVGLCWSGCDRGGPALAALAALLEDQGARFFSLQDKPSREDAAWLESRGIVDLEPEMTTPARTAALVEQLDGVIGVDSLPIHLAGALGKPACVLIGPFHHWRWLRHEAASPWYPSVRIQRRRTDESWEEVIGRIAPEVSGHPTSAYP